MTPQEKRAIEKFFHPKTIELFIGKHPAKWEKKQKMKALWALATGRLSKDEPPGSWLLQMDVRFRKGLP